MGGRPLFVLNLCCFTPEIPEEAIQGILLGAAEATAAAGAVLLGGHSVRDPELKFGLAVVGEAPPDRLLANTGALAGQALVLTKPLGTGVLTNAFKAGKLDDAGFEAALAEMERLNDVAARLALEHGATAATDITGFGLVGHALNIARGSGVAIRVRYRDLPIHDGFDRLVAQGFTTGCTDANAEAAAPSFRDSAQLSEREREILFDPQTSGGLLIALPSERAAALVSDLTASGHRACAIGEVVTGTPSFEIV